MNRTVCLLFACGFLSGGYAQKQSSNWFPFRPKTDYSHSKTNMKGWLDATAGKPNSGNRTGQLVPVKNGRFSLDSKKYKTIYYELANE